MNFDDTNLHCIVKDVGINKILAIGNCAAVDGWVSTEKFVELFIPRCQWLLLKTELLLCERVPVVVVAIDLRIYPLAQALALPLGLRPHS